MQAALAEFAGRWWPSSAIRYWPGASAQADLLAGGLETAVNATVVANCWRACRQGALAVLARMGHPPPKPPKPDEGETKTHFKTRQRAYRASARRYWATFGRLSTVMVEQVFVRATRHPDVELRNRRLVDWVAQQRRALGLAPAQALSERFITANNLVVANLMFEWLDAAAAAAAGLGARRIRVLPQPGHGSITVPMNAVRHLTCAACATQNHRRGRESLTVGWEPVAGRL